MRGNQLEIGRFQRRTGRIAPPSGPESAARPPAINRSPAPAAFWGRRRARGALGFARGGATRRSGASVRPG